MRKILALGAVLALLASPALAQFNGGGGSGGGISTITANSTPMSGFAAGDLLYSDGSKSQAVGPGTSTTLLHGGTTPSYGAVNLATDVTGVLPVSINAQTGTTYTVLAADQGKLVTFSNSGAIAVTLPQATGATFGAGYSWSIFNQGVGAATVTPTTSTINGAATLACATGQGAIITSDGANWQLASNTCGFTASVPSALTATTLALNGASLPTNSQLALNYSPGANTATPGAAIINANAATSGNQQFSCSILSGNGWKTTATAASQQVDWQICNEPVQGTTAPTAGLVVASQINGGGYTTLMDYNVSNASAVTFSQKVNVSQGTDHVSGLYFTGANVGFYSPGGSNFFFSVNGAVAEARTSGIGLGVVSVLTWGTFGTTQDTGLSRVAAGIVGVGTSANGSVAGQLKTAGVIIASTAPTVALAGGTCAGTVIAGGATAGTVTLTGVCAATNTMTLSVMPTAPNGYACDANDRTAPTALLTETSTSATTAVFTFGGTSGATDVIQYKCLAY